MLLLWLATYGLSFSPDFHRLLHKDAQKAGHTCLVTHLQHHSFLASFVATALPEPPASCVMPESRGEVQFFPSTDYLVSKGRAPPRFFSSTTLVG